LRAVQDETEESTDKFIRYTQYTATTTSRTALAKLLNAPPETLAFVNNATTGINTFLRNLVYQPGDKILVFSTIYNACLNTVLSICETTPASYVKVPYTYPISDADLIAAFTDTVTRERAAGNRVAVAVFDTIVSLPGVRMPFEALISTCRDLGVLSCVDGAHGIGQLDLDLTNLDPDFFVSNCHKWLFVPRGCAVVYVPTRNQHLIRTSYPTSHSFVPQAPPAPSGPGNPLPPSKPGQTRFTYLFDLCATSDLSPYFCIPTALAFREEACGGEARIRSYCTALARDAGDRAAQLLGTEVLDNAEGTLRRDVFMFNVRLPLGAGNVEMGAGGPVGVVQWMATRMLEEHGTFMALLWHGGCWWVRFSAQVYLELEDFEWGAEVLRGLCERVEKGEHLG